MKGGIILFDANANVGDLVSLIRSAGMDGLVQQRKDCLELGAEQFGWRGTMLTGRLG